MLGLKRILLTSALSFIAVFAFVNFANSALRYFTIPQGGTGTSTAPTYGQLLMGDSDGNYEFTATSSLGLGSTATNDWGRFLTTYGAKALMTSSTYNVFFDGAVYASSTLSITGDLNLIRAIPYSFPAAQGGVSTVLTNDGSGALTWSLVSGATNDWGRFLTTYSTSSLMTSTTRPVWFSGLLFASSTSYIDSLISINSTSTYTTTTDLYVSGTLSLPANSVTDAMVVDTLTASNYLPLTGGTLSGLLTAWGGILTNTSTIGSLTVSSTLDLTWATITGLASSDLSDASNIAYLGSNNIFTGENTFNGVIYAWGGILTPTSTIGALVVTSTANFGTATVTGLSTADLSDAANIAFLNLSNVFSQINTFSLGLFSTASSSFTDGLQVTKGLYTSSTVLIGGNILTFNNGEVITNLTDGILSFSDDSNTNLLFRIMDEGTTGSASSTNNLGATGVLQTGGAREFTSYNRFGATGQTSESTIVNSSGDVFINDNLEVMNTVYLWNGLIGGASSTFTSIMASGNIAASTTLGVTNTSTFYSAILQTGLTNCNAENQTVLYNSGNGLFTCGADDTGAASTNDWGRFGTTFNEIAVMPSTSLRGVWLDGSLYVSTSIYVSGSITPIGGLITSTLDGVVIGGTTRAAGNFTNLDANGAVTLPINSITDAMVANDVTASNYLPLLGGTLTGGLTINGNGGLLTSTSTIGALTVTSTLNLTWATITGLASTDLSDSSNLAYLSATNAFSQLNTFSLGTISNASSSFGSSLMVSGYLSASTTLGVTNTTTLYSAFLQNGLANCNNETQTLLYSADNGLFSCGTDATSAAVDNWGRFGVTFSTSSLMVSTTRPVWFDIDVFASTTLYTNNLSIFGTTTSTGLIFADGGFISSVSSTFSAKLNTYSVSVSSSLTYPDGTVDKTGGRVLGGEAYYVTTTDRVKLGFVDTASTISKCTAVISCPNGCEDAPIGIDISIRHGTNAVASTTATQLFTAATVNLDSTTTLQTFCATGCTKNYAFNDNTMAANEILMASFPLASTTQMSVVLGCTVDNR